MQSNIAHYPRTLNAFIDLDATEFALSEHSFEDIFPLVEDDFQGVNELTTSQLNSDVPLITKVGRYITESGGKRLRPLIVLLCARACGYLGNAHVALATLVEFLHTATLLHDDVVDASYQRRGRASANALFGNAASILVGDFIYSRSFQLMVSLNSMRLMSIFSDATNLIAEGEVMQLQNVGNADLDEQSYNEIVRCKTALLFQAAAETSAVLAQANPKYVNWMRQFGLQFGFAYQLIDDYLDYSGDSEVLGKNVGVDIAEGKMTLPLIFALQTANSSDKKLIREAIEQGSNRHCEAVINAVRSSGALAYTKQRAVERTEMAICHLQNTPSNKFRKGLESLAINAVLRFS